MVFYVVDIDFCLGVEVVAEEGDDFFGGQIVEVAEQPEVEVELKVFLQGFLIDALGSAEVFFIDTGMIVAVLGAVGAEGWVSVVVAAFVEAFDEPVFLLADVGGVLAGGIELGVYVGLACL